MAVVLHDFDLPAVRRAGVDVAVADIDAPVNMERIPDASSWYAEGERRVLLQVADSVTEVAAGDLEEYKAEVASHLQDFVVDETGRPWPEQAVDGAVRVLDVRRDGLGQAVWSYAGLSVAPVGQLRRGDNRQA